MLQSDVDLNDEDPTHEKIMSMLNALHSTETTPEEQALGHFTHCELQTLKNWPDWLVVKQKQLDQLHELGKCGELCKLPPNSMLLRSH